MLGEHDGCALEVYRPVPRLEVNLCLVAAPRAVLNGHNSLAEGRGGRDLGAVHLVTKMSV